MAIGDSPKQQNVVRGNTIRAPRGSEEFNLQLDDERPVSPGAAAADEPTVHAHTQLGLRNLGSNNTYGGGATAFGIHRFGLDDLEAAPDAPPASADNGEGFGKDRREKTGVRAALQGMDDNWLDAIGDYLKSDSKHGASTKSSPGSAGNSASGAGIVGGRRRSESSASVSALAFSDSTSGGLAPPKPAGILRKRKRTRTSSAAVELDPMLAPAHAFLSEEPALGADDTDPPVVSANEQVTRTVDVEAELRKQRTANAFVDTVMDVKPPVGDLQQPPSTSFSPPPPKTAPQPAFSSDTPAPPFGLRPPAGAPAPPPVGNLPPVSSPPPLFGGGDAYGDIARGPTMMDGRPPLNSPPGGEPTVASVNERRERWGSGSWATSAAAPDAAPEAAVSRRRAPVETPALGLNPESDELGALFAELNASDAELPFLGHAPEPAVARSEAPVGPPRAVAETPVVRPEAAPAKPPLVQGRNAEQPRQPAAPDAAEQKPRARTSTDSVFALLAGGLTILACIFLLAWLFLN